MVAIIAGTGNIPLHACKYFVSKQIPFFVISLFPENNIEKIKNFLPSGVEVIGKPFFKVSSILEILKEKKTEKVLFIGKVDKQNLLKKIKLDFLAIKLLSSLATKNDQDILDRLAIELEKHGMKVVKQDEVLSNLFVKPGILCGDVTTELREDIDFGLNVARNLSKCSIGQTVVVKNKMVLAVEAIEGTSECIKRGIFLGKGDVVVCKTARFDHDTKFDIPTLGPDSLNELKSRDVKAIAWDSSMTFVVDEKEFKNKASALNISLLSV